MNYNGNDFPGLLLLGKRNGWEAESLKRGKGKIFSLTYQTHNLSFR